MISTICCFIHPRTLPSISTPTMKLSGLFVAAFCAAALGMSLDDLVEHERRADGSVMVKRAVPAGDAQVPVRIALKQSNLDKGMDLLMEV